MSETTMTLEEWRALSDEEREIEREKAAYDVLSKVADTLEEELASFRSVPVDDIAARCSTDRTTVERIISSFGEHVARDVAMNGKAMIPGLGVVHIASDETSDDGDLVINSFAGSRGTVGK